MKKKEPKNAIQHLRYSVTSIYIFVNFHGPFMYFYDYFPELSCILLIVNFHGLFMYFHEYFPELSCIFMNCEFSWTFYEFSWTFYVFS